MRIIMCFAILFIAVSCGSKNESSSISESSVNGIKANENLSASDMRRSIASQVSANKDFTKTAGSLINYDRAELKWSCDREQLPRTCCYHLITNGGAVYGSPSCVEENH